MTATGTNGPGRPEPFEAFYLREYPQVVGLLHGLLGSRLVAEELAQETFVVAYRDWDRISGLDNPRAWVRKVAINQRGLFLRAYLRQQTKERRRGSGRGGPHQARRRPRGGLAGHPSLPPLQAQVIALHYYEDYSVAQVAAALGKAPGTIKAQLHHGRRNWLGCSAPRPTLGGRGEHRRAPASSQPGPQGQQRRPGRRDQPVARDRPAHRPAGGEGRSAVPLDEPQESPRRPAASSPPSGKATAAPAGASAAGTSTSRWTDGRPGAPSIASPPAGMRWVGCFGSIWGYKSLIAAAVLLGALLGSGWAARQPTLYEGVTRVVLEAGSDPAILPLGEPEGHLGSQAQLMNSAPVLERAVKQSGSRISVETLRQRLEIDVAAEADAHDPGGRFDRDGGGTASRRGGGRLPSCPCPTDRAPTQVRGAPAASNVGRAGRRLPVTRTTAAFGAAADLAEQHRRSKATHGARTLPPVVVAGTCCRARAAYLAGSRSRDGDRDALGPPRFRRPGVVAHTRQRPTSTSSATEQGPEMPRA